MCINNSGESIGPGNRVDSYSPYGQPSTSAAESVNAARAAERATGCHSRRHSYLVADFGRTSHLKGSRLQHRGRQSEGGTPAAGHSTWQKDFGATFYVRAVEGMLREHALSCYAQVIAIR